MSCCQQTRARAPFGFFYAVLAVFCAASVVRAQVPTQAVGLPESASVPASVPAASTAPLPTEDIRPVLLQVQSALGSVEVEHWKLSRQGKDQMEADAGSIQQDLSGPLPGLLDQAKAAPTELAPQWAVVQNLDALYDVLVRVTTTANLVGPRADASLLTEAEAQLARARKDLTVHLVTAAGNQDKELAALHLRLTTMAAPQAIVPPGGKTVVVNDAAPHSVRRHVKKPIGKPSAIGRTSGSKPTSTGKATQPGDQPQP
ncbi:MAG: hypothetical protein ACP5EP_03045 [Acidobacteriaceae bacterium]